jgi:hypothetical protein
LGRGVGAGLPRAGAPARLSFPFSNPLFGDATRQWPRGCRGHGFIPRGEDELGQTARQVREILRGFRGGLVEHPRRISVIQRRQQRSSVSFAREEDGPGVSGPPAIDPKKQAGIGCAV